MTEQTSTGLPRNQQVAGVALSLIRRNRSRDVRNIHWAMRPSRGPRLLPSDPFNLADGVRRSWSSGKEDDAPSIWRTRGRNGRPLAIIAALGCLRSRTRATRLPCLPSPMLIVLLGVLERRDWRVVLCRLPFCFLIATYALLHDALKITLPSRSVRGFKRAMSIIENLLSGFAFALQPSGPDLLSGRLRHRHDRAGMLPGARTTRGNQPCCCRQLFGLNPALFR